MKKLVSNPVKVRLERPGHVKFKLSDLGLDIRENPGIVRNARKKVQSKPKEYQIVETPNAHSYSASLPRTRVKENTVKISVYSRNINENSYICFDDSSRAYCLPMSFQLTQNTVSRLVHASNKNIDIVDLISKEEIVDLNATESDFNLIKSDAEKYGLIIDSSESRSDIVFADLIVLKLMRVTTH